MKRTVVIVSISLILLVAAGFGAYHLYDTRYLTPTLKRTLTAAMDSSASRFDILSYLRDARLQVRTKRDAEVLKMFQDAVDHVSSAHENHEQYMQLVHESLDSEVNGDSAFRKRAKFENEYRSRHQPVPTDVLAMLAEYDARDALREQEEKILRESASQEEEWAKALFTEIRSILGLPPTR